LILTFFISKIKNIFYICLSPSKAQIKFGKEAVILQGVQGKLVRIRLFAYSSQFVRRTTQQDADYFSNLMYN